MEYIACFICGWYVGRFVLKFSMFRATVEAIEEMHHAVPYRVRVLHTELIENSVFLYDTHSSEFMCRGTDLAEVAHNLKVVCQVRAATVMHNNIEVLIIDGKVRED